MSADIIKELRMQHALGTINRQQFTRLLTGLARSSTDMDELIEIFKIVARRSDERSDGLSFSKMHWAIDPRAKLSCNDHFDANLKPYIYHKEEMTECVKKRYGLDD